ncbi:MAG: hypothetical protein QX189_13290 [Methylococcales bacterium]
MKHSAGIETHNGGFIKRSRGIVIANTSAKSWNKGGAAYKYWLAT